MNRIRSAFVVGRRDFMATVASKSFLFFLLGPLFPVAMGILFGTLGERLGRADDVTRVAIVADAATQARIAAADRALRPSLNGDALPTFSTVAPSADPDAQVRRLLADKDLKVEAVWTGGYQAPRLTGAVAETGRVRRGVSMLVSEARQQAALPGSPTDPAAVAVTSVQDAAGQVASLRTITARIAQVLLFFLTVLLSTMLLSQMVEEKGSKVIEILTAALPVNAIFLGKLFAMLAISLVGLAVWATAGAIAAAIWLPPGLALPTPAVGWPAFALLFLLYFTAAYLLLGALFLGIGAQASSVREVQIMSMPVTMGQVVVFALGQLAVGQYAEPLGLGATVFPFSSPFVMIARAAEFPDLWPHLLALAWAAYWVLLIIRVGAGLFRRSVLKSGAGAATSKRRGLFARA